MVNQFSFCSPVSDCEPAHYFPIRGSRYEVAAGLHKLGTPFGNAEMDNKLFQLDRLWKDYRQEKMRARKERIEKYVCQNELNKSVEQALVALCLDTLPKEYPTFFHLQHSARQSAWILHCGLSGEALYFDQNRNYQYHRFAQNDAVHSEAKYHSGMDALACQLQEDLAIIEINGKDEERLTALHLCFPNHWAAADKIGSSFSEMHTPVPGFETLARKSQSLLKHLLRYGPYVRFAWGLATDTQLNHHPQAPIDASSAVSWTGRSFNPDQPELYLRIERQVLYGLPEVRALLFTIRTYFEDIASLKDEQRKRLRLAIQSMDDKTLQYKGIHAYRDEVLTWLSR